MRAYVEEMRGEQTEKESWGHSQVGLLSWYVFELYFPYFLSSFLSSAVEVSIVCTRCSSSAFLPFKTKYNIVPTLGEFLD